MKISINKRKSPTDSKCTLIALLAIICLGSNAQAQPAAKVSYDSLAVSILNTAFGGLGTKQSYAMYFETIALQVDKPSDVFNLPGFKLFKGGYMIIQGTKFEMNLGAIKALSDGKLMVMTNELIHTMVIDSVRFSGNNKEAEKLMDKWLGDNLKDGVLTYEGIEKVNGKPCHKIKNTFKDASHDHVLYYVAENTGMLYLMAEKQQSSYNVYVVRKIAEAEKNHNFTIKALPKQTIEEMKGYEVIDMRFARAFKKSTN